MDHNTPFLPGGAYLASRKSSSTARSHSSGSCADRKAARRAAAGVARSIQNEAPREIAGKHGGAEGRRGGAERRGWRCEIDPERAVARNRGKARRRGGAQGRRRGGERCHFDLEIEGR